MMKMLVLIIVTLLWAWHPSFAAPIEKKPRASSSTKKYQAQKPPFKKIKKTATSATHPNPSSKKKLNSARSKKSIKKKPAPPIKKKQPLAKNIQKNASKKQHSTSTKLLTKKSKKKTYIAKAHPPLKRLQKTQIEPNSSFDLATSIEQRLVNYVHKTVNNLHYTSYKLGGTRFDPSRGVYVVDCSHFVDGVLKKAYPHAYFNLVNSTGSDKPTTSHYYDFFTTLSDDQKHFWNKVDDIEALEPGDILVFRTKGAFESEGRGHVMVVMDKPIRNTDSFLLRVADSAPIGHSQDTRLPHVSGVGIGTMLLKANPLTGQPYAYAWKVGSRWKKNVDFAMARPLGLIQS